MIIFRERKIIMMKHITLSLLLICFFSTFSFAISTLERVHQIVQTNGCAVAGCHDASAAAGLDLSGTHTDLYNAIVNVDPSDGGAMSDGHKRVSPGYPYRSHFLLKLNNGLIDAEDGAVAPTDPNHAGLTDIEVEMVRQWIIMGSPSTGEVVDEAVIDEYYIDGGVPPVTRPAPPAPGQGFQVHMGPIFIPPGQEDEFMMKYDPQLTGATEISRVDVKMSDLSHHYILYKLDRSDASNYDEGLRDISLFNNPFTDSNEDLVAVWQYDDNIELPAGTAFFWDENTILDLNYHVPNYSNIGPAPTDVYMNVYTQATGTAEYEMKSELFLYTSLFLPPNQTSNFSGNINNNQDWFIWMMTSHTHQYGTDFDVYVKEGNSKGEQLYEGFYNYTDDFNQGYYDWEHQPIRYFDPFYQLPAGQGLIQEASYYNSSNSLVTFGLQSTNEMMITILQYTEGLPNPPAASITNLVEGYCETETTSSLQLIPAGGTLSGTGVSANTFDPSAAGPGMHTLTYTYASSSDNVTVTVDALPTLPSITESGGTLSVPSTYDSYQWYLDGNPISGAIGATYTPTVDGDYQVEIASGYCSDVSGVYAYELVVVQILDVESNYCESETSTGINLSPAGGQLYVDGDAVASFDPSSLGAGTYILTYTYNGQSVNETVTVDAMPMPGTISESAGVLSIAGTFDTYQWYFNGNPISGATTASHAPTADGDYTIEVTSGICSATTAAYAFEFVVVQILDVESNYCESETSTGINLSPAGGQLYVDGDAVASFDPSSLGAGTYILTYTYNGQSVNETVTVDAMPMPGTISESAGVLSIAGTFDTYQWYFNGNPISGATTASYSPNADGDYTIEVTNGTCSTISASYAFELVAVAILNLETDYCISATSTNIELNPAGGSLFLNDDPISEFIPADIGVGTYTISYTYNGFVIEEEVTIHEDPSVPSIALVDEALQTDGTYTTYQWYYGDDLIVGAESASYSPTQDGVYTLEVSNGFCTSSESFDFLNQGVIQLQIQLEGAYDMSMGMMRTILATKNLIELNQPYQAAPYNYAGTEALTSIPSDMVDWILIELRDADYNVLQSKACWLRSDGMVMDVAGTAGATFNSLDANAAYHLIVRHRNHIDIATANPLAVNNTSPYDLSDPSMVLEGANQLNTVGTVQAMITGDMDGDGVITVGDYNDVYLIESSLVSRYIWGDLNMDSNVTVADFNLYQPNASKLGVTVIRY